MILPNVIVQTSANVSSSAQMSSPNEELDENNSNVRRHRRQDQQQNRTDNDDEEIFKYGASHVVKLFVPVSLCMFIVIVTIKTTTSYTPGGAQWAYTPFTEDKQTNTQRILFSLANAMIFMAFVIAATFILILLYKFRCYK
ncbi:unnamed protein product, partial [Didymodactylos carnosus]